MAGSGNMGNNAAPRLPSGEVAPGYFLAPLATTLTFPTGIAVRDGEAWGSEAGIAGTGPEVKRVTAHRQRLRGHLHLRARR